MIVRIFAVLVLLIYPFAVWQLLEHGMIASAALFLAVAALLNACIKRSPIGFVCVACALVLACRVINSAPASHGGNLCATSA